MKKLLLTGVLALGISQLATINTAHAQSTGSPTSLINNRGVTNVAKALYLRMHTVSIDQHISEMQSDGVTERSYVAGFTIEGAMIFNHELKGDGFQNDDVDAARNAGFQILPYKVSYANDGRVLISTSIVAFKNMNKEMETDDLNLTAYNDNVGAFGVIDKIDLLNFQYNRDVAKNIEEYRFNPVSIDLKLGLFKSNNGQTFFALKGGTNPVGYYATRVYDLQGDIVEFEGFEAEVRYGAQFVTGIENGFQLQADLDFKNRWSVDNWTTSQESQAAYQVQLNDFYDRRATYNENLATYQADKAAWEQSNGYADSISTESYETITGIAKPNGPGKKPGGPSSKRSVGHLYLMTPSVKASWNINKRGSRPVRLGVGVSGNIPLGDIISGEINQDRTNIGNQELVTGKIFLNF